MKIFDIFPWNENFDTGLPEIDQQHHRLVELLNALARHLAYQTEQLQLNTIIDELLDYTVYHFQTEECIWHESLQGDEAEIQHKELHKGFIETIQRLKSDQAFQPSEQTAQDATTFLVRWLVSHILVSDKRMALTVLALRSGLDIQGAKRRAEVEISNASGSRVELILSVYSTLTDNTLRLMREISAHTEAHDALQASEERFRTYVDFAADGIFVCDAAGRFIDVNQQACHKLGYSRAELLRLSIDDVDADSDLAGILAFWAQMQPGRRYILQSHHRRKDGSTFPVEVSAGCCDVDGQRQIMGLAWDVTEREQNKAQLSSHNRLLQCINAISTSLLWQTDEAQLSQLVCQTLVEQGGFRMAWIGMVAMDGIHVRPVAEAGFEAGYLEKADVRCDDSPEGQIPAGVAIRTGSTVACPDTEADLCFAPWREFARTLGYRSTVSTPIRIQDKVIGVLSAYRALPNSIGQLELALLERLATDIGHVMQRLTNERWISQDRKQQAVLRQLLETTLMDDRFEETLGRCLDQLLSIPWLSLLPKGGIFHRKEGEDFLHLAVSRNLTPEIRTLCEVVPFGRCMCGRAAASGEIQFSTHVDERHDTSYPGMEDHGHYSIPLLSTGEVVGLLMLYLPPGIIQEPEHLDFLTAVGGILAGYLQRKRAKDALRIAAATFQSQEAVMITDADANIIQVNQAFEETTGYTAQEVVGMTPRIFKSGRHDAAFYESMWSSVVETGRWVGEIWDRRKNGEVYPKFMSITAVYDEQQHLRNYVCLFTDISQRKQSEEEIHRLAFYDPLTELPNRSLLMDRLRQALVASARSGRYFAVLMLDLDNFKTINDTLGHTHGDKLLFEVAKRLRTSVRMADTVSRLGGDEFVVVLENLGSREEEAAHQSEAVAEKICANLGEPYMLDLHEWHITPSIGICLSSGHQVSIEDLVKHADVALYQAKAAGRNSVRFYDPAMQILLDKRSALEGDLRKALKQQQFLLYYQIQVDNRQRPLGAEALLRWQHPKHGLVAPDQFIPLAEETGLIVPIGLWALETACTQLKKWEEQVSMRDLTLAVNVSARQFRQVDFVAEVQRILKVSGANPKRLKLELTESVVMDNVEDAIDKMLALGKMGVEFSMDDFGTGHSSLSNLKRLPLAQVKIDRTFVRDIATDSNDAAIVNTIIAMSRTLGISVIAEGVETDEQRQFLDDHGCHVFQGYLFGKPVPPDQFMVSVRAMVEEQVRPLAL